MRSDSKGFGVGGWGTGVYVGDQSESGRDQGAKVCVGEILVGEVSRGRLIQFEWMCMCGGCLCEACLYRLSAKREYGLQDSNIPCTGDV